MYASASSPGGLMSAALGAISAYQRGEAVQAAQSAAFRPQPAQPQTAQPQTTQSQAAPGGATRMPAVRGQPEAMGEISRMVILRAQQAYTMQTVG